MPKAALPLLLLRVFSSVARAGGFLTPPHHDELVCDRGQAATFLLFI
jgi:hypothetical protein